MSACGIVFLSHLVPYALLLLCHFAVVHYYDIIIFFPFSIKSFCQQGSVSELLLLLLSSWKNSVRRRPACVKSDPVSAVTVCGLVACPLPPLFHFLCREFIGGMGDKVGLEFEKE